MSETLVLDSWAFIETLNGQPQAEAVSQRMDATTNVLTTRDVLVETSNYLVRRSGHVRFAREWLTAVLDSRIRILEPPLEGLIAYSQRVGDSGGLSLTDLSVGWAAHESHTSHIATGDREFRRLGLDPLFADP